MPELIIKGWDGLNLANSKELFIGTVNVTNFDQMPDCSYWQFVIHGQGAKKQMSLVSPGFNWQIWKFQSIVEVTGKLLVCYWSLVRALYKNIHLVRGRSFPLKEHSNFPGCNAVRFLLVGCLVEIADKKELFKLLLDFFGPTFQLSWKQKSWFVMISLWLNDWVNEGCVQTVCLWGKICMKSM